MKKHDTRFTKEVVGIAILLSLFLAGCGQKDAKEQEQPPSIIVQEEDPGEAGSDEKAKDFTISENEISQDEISENGSLDHSSTESVSSENESLTGVSYVETTETVKLRSASNTDCDVITLLPGGTVLSKTGEENGFAIVDYQGKTGYVSEDYLKASKEPDATEGRHGHSSRAHCADEREPRRRSFREGGCVRNDGQRAVCPRDGGRQGLRHAHRHHRPAAGKSPWLQVWRSAVLHVRRSAHAPVRPRDQPEPAVIQTINSQALPFTRGRFFARKSQLFASALCSKA